LGANIYDSRVMRGLIVTRHAEGSITKVTKPKIAIYGCPLDPNQGDTKGTVLIKNATELLNYS
jgi:T-complex protein 1 subunit theta